MGVVVELMRESALVITQDEIETLIGLENQIRNLQRMFERQAADVLDRLMAGATVEPGTHTAEIEETREGGEIRTRLRLH